MSRASLAVLAALGAAGAWWWWSMRAASFGGNDNVRAFAAFTRYAEAAGEYNVIAGGDHFTDYSEHPFELDPHRRKPLNTTASGGYQMVLHTWRLARDFGDRLPDFTPDSQDAAFERLLRYKVPGQNFMNPDGTGNYELVAAGKFAEALDALALEWESFGKILAGHYHITRAEALAFIQAEAGNVALA